MEKVKNTINRRYFLKATALSGGGMLLGINWLSGSAPAEISKKINLAEAAGDWHEFNGFIKITAENVVKIMAPNPEFGQNVTTSMPMIVAEDLDVDWQNVVVEQAPFNTKIYTRQMAGGSQAIRAGWKALRTAGASARQMLRTAAAQTWGVPLDEISTKSGVLLHEKSGKSAKYGDLAAAAAKLEVPKEVQLKSPKDFKIVRNSQKNVEGLKIVTGKPMFGLDYRAEGMQIAMIEHPPAFGMTPKSFDDSEVRKMPGISDVFTIKLFEEGSEVQLFDTRSFNEAVVVVGRTTWEVMNARKKLKIEWATAAERKETVNIFGNKVETITPAGLESTTSQLEKMVEMSKKPAKLLRRDGDPEAAFKSAHKIIERTYNAPFLAHNTMEPMNCFAHVTEAEALLVGPLQAPEFAERTIATRLGLPLEKVDIQMTRMGGGFGRRAYCQYMVEAALISQKAKTPIKLVYSREDDMTYGIYRPMYTATYRAAFDADKNLIAFHVNAGGIPESPLGRSENRFPAGAIDNYLAEEWAIPSNVTIGAFRAPRSNFLAAAEQSFLDEVAEAMGKDPIDLRLDLLKRAKENPVGKTNDYDADRYAGVLRLVREKSGWDKVEKKKKKRLSRGVSAYFCHNSYVAHVIDVKIENGQPVFENVFTAVDCGIVINPDAAVNMVEGAVVDGIGNAMFGSLTMKDGKPDHSNFNSYRMIRMPEAPRKIEVHFVQNEIDPTGLGEPPFPPVFGAVANALYRAKGKRFYNQPFSADLI